MGRPLLPAMLLTLGLTPAPAPGARAIVTDFVNTVNWPADGRIDAIAHRTHVTGGVNGNLWPDLALTPRVGQTFRCDGPRLVGVQLGLDNVDTGYRGLTYRRPGSPIAMRLRKDGPDGPLVAERIYQPDAMRPDLLLAVDLACDPTQLWYAEVEPLSRDFPAGFNFVNATVNDSYPDGRMYLDGEPTEGDLHLRFTSAAPVAGLRPGPAVFWAADARQRIWMEPDRTIDLMLADDPEVPWRETAAGGERVSWQLIVTPRPDRRVVDAVLRVDPFTGPGDARLDDLRIEWLRYTHDFHRKRTSGRLYPDPLAPTHAARAIAGEPDAPLNRAFWISLRVPEGAAAGLYRTTARVSLDDGSTLTRAVEIEVLDFDLPRRTHTRTALFRGSGGSLQRHLWWARDLAEFRIALGTPFFQDLNSVQRGAGFSPDSYERILGPAMQQSLVAFGRLMNERGLDVTNVTPWGDTYRMFRGEDGGREGIVRFWQTYHGILKEHGWLDQAYCRMPDELKGDQIERVRSIVALFHEHAPGVRVLVTNMGTHDPAELERGIGIADIWCPGTRYLPRAMPFWQQRRAAGESVWPYIHDFTWHPADLAAPRMFFWMLQRYGFDGACYFCVMRARFEPAWHGVRRYSDTWPGDGDLYYAAGLPEDNVEGLWRSARLYRIGDGLEDRETFWLLNDLAARARAAGVLTDALRRRVADLNEAPDTVVYGLLNFSADFDRVASILRAVGETIVALEKALGGSEQ